PRLDRPRGPRGEAAARELRGADRRGPPREAGRREGPLPPHRDADHDDGPRRPRGPAADPGHRRGGRRGTLTAQRATPETLGGPVRVRKNSLRARGADKAGADTLKELLEGPTAFTFVRADGGDAALAAKALAQFHRQNEVLDFKGGTMGGDVLTVEELQTLSR